MEYPDVADRDVAMQKATLGNEGAGADERERRLKPILTDAELPYKISVQREEVLSSR